MVQAEDDAEEFKLELRTVEAAVAVVLVRCPLRVGALSSVINGTDHSTSMDAVLDWSCVTSKDIMKTDRCISNTDQSKL